jgi:hypothetical protein
VTLSHTELIQYVAHSCGSLPYRTYPARSTFLWLSPILNLSSTEHIPVALSHTEIIQYVAHSCGCLPYRTYPVRSTFLWLSPILNLSSTEHIPVAVSLTELIQHRAHSCGCLPNGTYTAPSNTVQDAGRSSIYVNRKRLAFTGPSLRNRCLLGEAGRY